MFRKRTESLYGDLIYWTRNGPVGFWPGIKETALWLLPKRESQLYRMQDLGLVFERYWPKSQDRQTIYRTSDDPKRRVTTGPSSMTVWWVGFTGSRVYWRTETEVYRFSFFTLHSLRPDERVRVKKLRVVYNTYQLVNEDRSFQEESLLNRYNFSVTEKVWGSLALWNRQSGARYVSPSDSL